MQQINLYLPEFRPKQDWLKLEFSLLGVALVAVLAVVLQYLANANVSKLQTEVTQMEQRKEALLKQVEKLKQKPSPAKKQELEQQASSLREAIKNRRAIAGVIQGQSLGNREGFSHYLLAMGSELVEGVALSSLDFSKGGRFAALKGEAKSADLVPLYLGSLQQHSAFKDTRFGVLSIVEDKGVLKFTTQGDPNLVVVSMREKHLREKVQ